METKTIYYNRSKSFMRIILGIGILIGTPIILIASGGLVKTLWFAIFPAIYYGFSFIYFGLKGLSKKPQIIFSEEGLYVGFKYKKTIPWKSIVKITFKTKKVDFRQIEHMCIARTIKTKGPSNKLFQEFPIENLANTN